MSKRFDEYTEQTSLTGTDLVLVETDPTGTHVTKKMQISTFFTNIVQFVFAKSTAPANPDSGFMKLYADTNGFMYTLDSSGVSRKLSPVRYFQFTVFPTADTVTTGDDKVRFDIPADIGGMNLVYCLMTLDTVSSSGLPTVQIRNVTDSVDMLSTKLSIDANEYTSLTAAAPAVIDGSKDDVAEGDRLAIDCDIAGTGTKGLRVTLGFQYP